MLVRHEKGKFMDNKQKDYRNDVNTINNPPLMKKEADRMVPPACVLYHGIDKSIRESRGISQQQLVNLCMSRFSLRTLRSYEQGKREASAGNLMYMSLYLDTSIDALLGRPPMALGTNENSMIVKHVIEGGGFLRPLKQEYKLATGIPMDTSRLIAITLEEDSLLLGASSGSTMIVDRDINKIKQFDNDDSKEKMYVIIRTEKEGITTALLVKNRTPRCKTGYLYYSSRSMIPTSIVYKDLDTIYVGKIVKIIRDFE